MVKAVLIRISTQEIIKFDNYPSKHIEPLELSESDGTVTTDLKWLIINELDKPSFDPFTEKLTKVEEITTDIHPIYVLLHQYRISFPIIALTAQEVIDHQQGVDDSDGSSETVQNHKFKGIEGFDRAIALIQRRFDNGVITANQAKGLAQALYPDLEPLYKGLWQLVKMNLDAVTPPTNADLLEIFNKIKNGVDNYVTNNF